MPDSGRKSATQGAGSSPGLCAACQHARETKSDRGSTFVQCHLSFTNKKFAKYPRLPVIVCSGYEENQGRAAGANTGN